MDVKVKSIRRFLEEGDRVHLVVLYRGREVVHPDIGVRLLQTVLSLCGDVGSSHGQPVTEGKRTTVNVVPRRRG